MSKPVKKASKKKNGYVMPDPIPNGEIVQDMAKKKWIIGPSIGVGGFGEIYSAAEYTDSKKLVNYPYVIKIEPHGNGPLFVEMHFYMRNAKADDIEAWRSKKKLSSLGMPSYIGSGSHECNGEKYRFVVMERFGKDLWHMFLENKRCFPIPTVFRIGVQMLDVLEYIHGKGYVHADIKGANALLGITKRTQNQVFLVDFGLAAHYSTKEYKPDPKKAHNGTIEYTSRDAHAGVPTRRGDLEILGYNLIQWLGCTLPWEKNLTDPSYVQASKIKYMENTDDLYKLCFGKRTVPNALKEFVNYIAKMNHDTEPNYEKCRSILISGLESSGGMLKGPLDFKLPLKSPAKRKSDHVEPMTPPSPEKKRKAVSTKKTVNNENDPDTKPTKRGRKKKVVERSEDVEESEECEESPAPKKGRGKKADKSEEGENSESNGYTAEMLRVMKKIETKNTKTKPKRPIIKSTGSSSSGAKASVDLSDSENIIDETPPEKPHKKVGRKKINKGEGDLTPSRRKGIRTMAPVYYGSDTD